MIPADHITIDGDTALWLRTTIGGEVQSSIGLNRPCDTCDGSGLIDPSVSGDECPDCDGTGRHTFDIEWVRVYDEPGTENKAGERVALRVHVIDVLPIVSADDTDWPSPCVEGNVIYEQTEWGEWGTPGDWSECTLTLPPAAEPGMWLVRLAVHDG